MQDRYAGDVGDFGKFGMLRCIEESGLRVGINWYLVGDESNNNDGKHIGYLKDEKYRGCDDGLLVALESMHEQGARSVSEIEKLNLLNTQVYYHERIIEPRKQNGTTRGEWHQNALMTMMGCDFVFLDPDNGMIPKSVSLGSDKSIKYVLPEEIMDYYKAGYSVAFYSHRTREQIDVYLERFWDFFEDAKRQGAIIKGISFKRGTVRDYFFLLHNEHLSQVETGIENLLQGKWSQHFEVIKIPNKNVMVNAIRPFFANVGKIVTEIIDSVKQVIQSEEVQQVFKGILRLHDIIKLGEENNWVVILPGIDFDICGKTQEKIDGYFVKYIEQDNEVYQKIKSRILSSELLKERSDLLMQTYSSIELGHYALAGISLSTTIEYMLALNVGYDKIKIKMMIEDFKNNIGDISVGEEGLIPAFGLEGFLANFSYSTKGFDKEKEPRFVNRHWVAHGRMHRDLNKVDVYQMLCAIYALDVVIALEQRVKDQDDFS